MQRYYRFYLDKTKNSCQLDIIYGDWFDQERVNVNNVSLSKSLIIAGALTLAYIECMKTGKPITEFDYLAGCKYYGPNSLPNYTLSELKKMFPEITYESEVYSWHRHIYTFNINENVYTKEYKEKMLKLFKTKHIFFETPKVKRKYNLPKYVCWDIRNTVTAKKVWFGVSLIKNGKHTNTAAKTVKEAMNYVIQNRLSEKIWTVEEAKKYQSTYYPAMEDGYSVELAEKLSNCNRNKKVIKKEIIKINNVKTTVENNNTSNGIKTKRRRMYNLPKYICYDKAESRNRERNVFQTSLKVNDKLLKNNLYTVKDAVIDVASKMLEHTDIWSLDNIADYLKTYKSEMENGNFVPSNTPKSPCWRKREKKKNIQTIKEQISSKLTEIFKFAKDNDINIDMNIH